MQAKLHESRQHAWTCASVRGGDRLAIVHVSCASVRGGGSESCECKTDIER